MWFLTHFNKIKLNYLFYSDLTVSPDGIRITLKGGRFLSFYQQEEAAAQIIHAQRVVSVLALKQSNPERPYFDSMNLLMTCFPQTSL